MKNRIVKKILLTAMALFVAYTVSGLPGTVYAVSAAGSDLQTDTDQSLQMIGDDAYIDAAMTMRDEKNSCQVVVTAVLPENFGLVACYADIRNMDTDTVYRFMLYRDNAYQAYAFLPPGGYQMTEAGVLNDNQNLYDFVLAEDWEMSGGEVAEVTVTLSDFAGVTRMIEDKEASIHPEITDDNDEVTEKSVAEAGDEANKDVQDEKSDPGQSASLSHVVGVAAFMLLCGVTALLLFRKYMLDQIPPDSAYRFFK